MKATLDSNKKRSQSVSSIKTHPVHNITQQVNQWYADDRFVLVKPGSEGIFNNDHQKRNKKSTCQAPYPDCIGRSVENVKP